MSKTKRRNQPRKKPGPKKSAKQPRVSATGPSSGVLRAATDSDTASAGVSSGVGSETNSEIERVQSESSRDVSEEAHDAHDSYNKVGLSGTDSSRQNLDSLEEYEAAESTINTEPSTPANSTPTDTTTQPIALPSQRTAHRSPSSASLKTMPASLEAPTFKLEENTSTPSRSKFLPGSYNAAAHLRSSHHPNLSHNQQAYRSVSPHHNLTAGKKPFIHHQHTSSLPSLSGNQGSSTPTGASNQASSTPSNPKRPAYIRQISGFSVSSFPNFSPLVTAASLPPGKNGASADLSTPASLLLDDSASTHTTNYGSTYGPNYGGYGNNYSSPELTQLPRRGKLKPELKSYWAYYLPALEWIPQYNRKALVGDICAGLTLASFQIPISMSYANSLAHVPMVCGLYGLVIGPLVYGLMGTTPYMVVGPEAALSLVVGQSVLPYLDSDTISPAHVSGIVSGACGAILLCAGLLRFGFLDSVLSRALLRGFISAVGFVMVIDQLIPELKLDKLLHNTVGPDPSTWEKVIFLTQNFSEAHKLTATVAFTAMAVIIAFRVFKAKFSHVFKKIIFVPEILIVVILSTILTDWLDLDQRGIDVVGKIHTGHVGFHLPFSHTRWAVFKDTFSASFVCAVLGFFESTIASKSLGASSNVSISTNRELVALGVTNVVGSMVNALPSFGGYGRSKINKLSGARTHLASFVLAITTAFCIGFAMHYFYYLPKCVLSSVISVIGLTLIEEAPRDILFYWQVGGYEDLFTMTLTLVCTVFWSLEVGIAMGVGFSVVRVIRHSTKSRIQILGRIPGTNTFENADNLDLEHLEEIDGCLICKIPEPLFFANTGDLRNRLRRLEVYGSMKVHPSFPRLRDEEMTRSVVFDLHGMTKCDASAMQILVEIISSYVVDRQIPVLLARVPQSKEIRTLLKRSGVDGLVTKPSLERYFGSIEEALRYIDQRGINQQNTKPGSVNRV